jgi:hypothetical protein
MQLKGAECGTLDCVGCGTDIHISSVCPHLTRRTRCVVSRTLKQRGHAGKSHSGVLRERPNGTVPAWCYTPYAAKEHKARFVFRASNSERRLIPKGMPAPCHNQISNTNRLPLETDQIPTLWRAISTPRLRLSLTTSSPLLTDTLTQTFFFHQLFASLPANCCTSIV